MAVYRDQMEHAIAPLIGRGFTVVGVLEAPKAFGNTELVLASKDLKLRFISDRGQTFVDVARTEAPGWYDLSEVQRSAMKAMPWWCRLVARLLVIRATLWPLRAIAAVAVLVPAADAIASGCTTTCLLQDSDAVRPRTEEARRNAYDEGLAAYDDVVNMRATAPRPAPQVKPHRTTASRRLPSGAPRKPTDRSAAFPAPLQPQRARWTSRLGQHR
jgi:hypothetical protein